jgi:hypothetical protein
MRIFPGQWYALNIKEVDIAIRLTIGVWYQFEVKYVVEGEGRFPTNTTIYPTLFKEKEKK